MEFIKCEHIPEDANGDEEGCFIQLGKGRVVALCELCSKALQLDMVSGFCRGAFPIPRPPYGYRR